MKRMGLLIAGLIFFSVAVSHAYDTVHVYINGKVDAVNSDTITIDGSQYKIDAKCRTVMVYKESDSFHEKAALIFDIHNGDMVTAKKIASTVYEIMIERWR